MQKNARTCARMPSAMNRSSARRRRRSALFPFRDTVCRDSKSRGQHGQGRIVGLLAAAVIVTAPSLARAHEQAVTVSYVEIADPDLGANPTTISWKADVAVDDVLRLPGLA